jgi:2-polyprenyl-3-methyl-5-hydroxy-6-metoxy-1,4-benzoquinol methylase
MPTSVESFVDCSSRPAGNAFACVLCDGATAPWMTVPGDWRRPNVADIYRLDWCDACQFGQLAPRPRAEEIGAFYACEQYYTHERPREVGGSSARLARLLVSLAWRCDRGVEAEIEAGTLARNGVRPPATICDVGCGNGGLLARLAGAGFEVVGIEPDAGARSVVEKAGFRVFAGSAESLPGELADAQFDVATMGHVLEHCLDPRTAVRNVARLIVPGGRFFVETPNNACLGARRAGQAWRWLDAPRHLNFFTPESLADVCEQAGLAVERIEFTGFTRQFGADWLADEREIEAKLQEGAARARAAGVDIPLPSRRSLAAAMGLLAASFRASDEQKYDSVRVVAAKR